MLPLSCETISARIVTLGDSLTFAYEAEFGFEISFFGTTYGDGFGPEVRNWVEILNDPIYRKEDFDLGGRNNIRLLLRQLFFRHDRNWAIPGLKIDGLRRFVSGDATLTDLLAEDESFASLQTALNLSNFDEEEDFALADMENQIRNDADRLTLFIGGNDVRAIYQTVYNGGSAGSFTEDFIDDAEFVIDRVQELNPGLEIVLVNVPHVGVTPDVKSTSPTDPVKTERVTALLRELNAELAQLASVKNIGYADVFTPTLPMLSGDPFCVHGIQFFNAGSVSGDLDFVWLNGPLSANFHPNTIGQAVIANVIINAFNRRYDTGIAPLTATEILGQLHGKSAAQIDMAFSDWMACFGLQDLAGNDDSDGDGISAELEFALGLNPILSDSYHVKSTLDASGESPMLELSYPIRLPGSTQFSLTPQWSENLTSGFSALAEIPVPGSDGLARAVFPMASSRGFLRLECVISP